MPRVYTIDGPARRKRRGFGAAGDRCKRVKMGGRGNRGCTIEGCYVGRKFKFQKGTKRC